MGNHRHPHPEARLRSTLHIPTGNEASAPKYAAATRVEVPAASTADRKAAAAERAAAVKIDSEAAIAPLLRIAAMTAARPERAARVDVEDHYNLRRWSRWSARWNG